MRAGAEGNVRKLKAVVCPEVRVRYRSKSKMDSRIAVGVAVVNSCQRLYRSV
jgi:hypothetical protein